ncbi:CRE-AVR-14 protein [Caenorhabditis remanei]|uniref:CRE-AVR-14 protein n=1 Tax=Caenorhabditis remanei TaxID=31234 RepID=E3M3L9_CAERE|nr:CRE-AVR-14 protein [Caenorhabditis remanei]
MWYHRLTTLLLIISIIHSVRSKRKLKEQEIIQRILKDYDWRVRPRGMNATWPGTGGILKASSDDVLQNILEKKTLEKHFYTGGPVLVTVNIYLRSISKIDDVNMEYSAQFTFREEWTDQRLAYERYEESGDTEVPPFVVLATSENADQSQQIWMPDTFFQNEKEARRHLIDKPNVLIRIHKNGQILYSVRLSLVLSCPMSLEFYPLDRQNCLIDLASYAYTTQDIKYEWKSTKPIQQKDGLRQSLPSFELQDVVTDYCTSLTNTGVTTLLTMTTQSSGINAKLPPVSYTKAIDVWIGVCLAFIFGALLEFALVNYAARKDMTQVSQRIRQMKQLPTDGYRPLSSSQGRSSFCCRIFVRRYKERSKRIDVVSRLDAVPARVSLGVTTLLTMTTQASGINSKLPPVSYIKAVDVWIGVCLAFIFGALLEYAVVNYYGRKEFLRKEKKKKTRIDDCVCPSDRPPLRLDLSAYRGVRKLPIVKRISELLSANIDISRRVDLMSRLTFPLTFFSFLIFYYQAYVKQSRDP